MNKIKKGDQVIVIAGKDKGKKGTVERVMLDRALVEGINVSRRHQRGNPGRGAPSAIVDKTMPIHISNLALYNPATGKADRVGFKFLEDGNKVRYFKSNREVISR